MANDVARNRAYVLILVLVVGFLLTIVAVGVFYLFFRSTPEAASSTIITPQNGAQIVFGGPVQVQSRHTGEETARVELRVIGATAAAGTLIGANAPSEGMVLQQWTPNEIGLFTVQVIALNDEDQTLSSNTIQVEVVDDSVVSIVPQQPQFAGVFQPPVSQPSPVVPTVAATATATATVTADQSADANAVRVVTATAGPAEPSPTGVLIFPPPPPAPGVPKGPIQEQLPELRPPVCNAAKYLGPFSPNTRQRVTITEPDPVPAKTAGGTLVHRIWEMQNTGTCTWGTGYELAFYGGRAMGSGGVAFEASYPTDVEPRNEIADQSRLIVPEGKPNQVARLEVLLQAPVTPGIHQSYWRMRNPQGVFFGPIIGVTLDIVRDCEFGIYGAPVINEFIIVGVGDVFQPDDPTQVTAFLGDTVTLQWNIINAQRYDIIITDPLGNTQNLSTNSLQDRRGFPANRLGEWTITLIAQNGSCTARASVTLKVIPPEGEQFVLTITSANPAAAGSGASGLQFSSAITPGSIGAEWAHFDTNVDEVTLFSSLYERNLEPECSLVIAGNAVLCSEPGWRPVQTIAQPLGDNAGAAVVTNIKFALASSSPITPSTTSEYQFRYVAQATQAGTLDPQQPCSNTVVEPVPLPATTLPTEISPTQAAASGQAQSSDTSPCIVTEPVAQAESSAPFVLIPTSELAAGQCVLTIGDLCLRWQEIILGGIAILIFILIIRAIFR